MYTNVYTRTCIHRYMYTCKYWWLVRFEYVCWHVCMSRALACNPRSFAPRQNLRSPVACVSLNPDTDRQTHTHMHTCIPTQSHRYSTHQTTHLKVLGMLASHVICMNETRMYQSRTHMNASHTYMSHQHMNKSPTHMKQSPTHINEKPQIHRMNE